MEQINRRNLLKVLGVSAAGTSVACNVDKPENILPYVVSDDDFIPGVPVYYATTCGECASSCGVIARNLNGRLNKVEGAPSDPVSAGGLCARGHAGLQSTYSDDRIVGSSIGTDKAAAGDVAAWLQGGAGKAVIVSGSQTGSIGQLLAASAAASGGQYLRFEPTVADAEIRAFRALGVGMPSYQLAEADLVVSFDADFLETYGNATALTRQFSLAKRRAGYKGSITVASRYSLTASNTDEWVAARPGTVSAVALAVLATVAEAKGRSADVAALLGGASVAKLVGDAEVSPARVDAVSKALLEAKAPVVLCGTGEKGGETGHAAVALLNEILGAQGSRVSYGVDKARDGLSTRQEVVDALGAATADDTLVAVDVDTQYLVGDTKARVLALAVTANETSAKADAVLAIRSSLESWSDAEPVAGLYKLAQPTMIPLEAYDAVDLGDAAIAIAGAFGHDAAAADAQTLVRNSWAARTGSNDAQAWNDALAAGQIVDLQAAAMASITAPTELAYQPAAAAAYVAQVYTSSRFYDGRSADRPWLHELPDTMTTIMWDGWAEVHPDLLETLGGSDGDMLTIKANGNSIALPVVAHIGARKDLVAVASGLGKSTGTHTANIGANAYQLLGADGATLIAAELSLQQQESQLVRTQNYNTQDQRGIAQAIDEEGNVLDEPPYHGGFENNYDLHPHPEYRWGLAVDLDACTGCGACVVACDSENNVPIVGIQTNLPPLVQPFEERVGKTMLRQGREMHWLRIERFFETMEGEEADVRFLPAMCQQCTNAPCESVCPVYATMHTPDGINAMVYNRCVGTRYCANNCPYKQRRLNWITFEWPEAQIPQLNPEVTVRTKGVMEKCTFCYQRVRVATMNARIEDRRVADGEITTACAQSCPADAMLFGDIQDNSSAIAQLVSERNSYRLLEPLNTRPGVHYLRKVIRKPVKA